MHYLETLSMLDAIDLAKQLIACPSITPDDAGCQKILTDLLKALEFSTTSLPFEKVNNFYAFHGNSSPNLLFAGHTDVVPPGDLKQWKNPPFKPTVQNETLYGRGAADMKGALAAMFSAIQTFVKKHPDHKGTISTLITSDEEIGSKEGTASVVDYLQGKKIPIDFCIIGEPTSEKSVGDTIKNGRRGSLHGQLTIYGKQGHIAYPHLASNPIHAFSSALFSLTQEKWDEGNQYFPPTQFQISNIHAGTGVTNVIPGQLEVIFNFRYSPESSVNDLKNRVESILKKSKLTYKIDWQLSGEPFLTPEGKLIQAARSVIKEMSGIETILSTSGGTSDGRFIAKLKCQVIELGLCNATIHQINENTSVQDIFMLEKIYYKLLEQLLT